MLTIAANTVFLQTFLTQRNLHIPKGTALYTYKTTQAEYDALRTLLTTAALTDQTAACFVLFAAEWWRRYYQGGFWEWPPIFEQIQRPEWNTPARRDDLMRKGCRYWNRPIFQHETGPNSLLGTLFFESGLPLGLLSHEGYIKDLLVNSFSFLQTYHTRKEDTFYCIGELAGTLPKALRGDAFYELVYKVIDPLLEFKNRYDLGRQPEPLRYLNECLPQWREELPLRIDDSPSAASFLDELLVDVVRMKKEETSKINLTYRLAETSDGWQIRSILSLKNGFYKPANLKIDEQAYAALSGKVLIKISTDEADQLIGFGFKTGNNDLSIQGLQHLLLPLDIHQKPWRLLFTDSQSDFQAAVHLPYSDGFDERQLWVFTHADEPELKGLGSVRLTANQAFVICPNDFIPRGEPDKIIRQGAFSPSQTLYAITGTYLFEDPQEAQVFRVKLAEPLEEAFYVSILPQAGTLPFYSKKNADVFLGFPRIRKIVGNRSVSLRDTLQYRSQEAWNDLPATGYPMGRFKVRSRGSEGEVLFCREITVLPANFQIRFEGQQLLLCNTSHFRLGVESQDLDTEPEISKDGSDYRIKVKQGSQGELLRLRLIPQNTHELTLVVPYPSAPSCFKDGRGQLMTNYQKVDKQSLLGTQLIVNNVTAYTQLSHLTFTLQDIHNRDASLHQISRHIKIDPFSNQEISLISYESDIERLLSYGKGIDAQVRIQYNGGLSICVGLYTYSTGYDSETRRIRRITFPTADLSLQALYLNERFTSQKLVSLHPDKDGWCLPEHLQGRWFYFSSQDSPLALRPGVAIQEEKSLKEVPETIMEFHEASSFSYEDRRRLFIHLFDQIAYDFTNVNWTTLQELYQATNHLAFKALDVWPALFQSERAVVHFFLYFESAAIDRLSQQVSINWYKMPVNLWIEGFRTYYQHLLQTLPETVAQIILQQKLQELETGYSLESLAQIIRYQVLGEPVSLEFRMCQHTLILTGMIQNEIFGSQGNMGLLQKHPNRIPTNLQAELEERFKLLPASLKALLPSLPQPYLRPLVYLPVVLAFQSVHPDTLSFPELDRYLCSRLIEFDESFFKYLYNLIQASCWLTHNL